MKNKRCAQIISTGTYVPEPVMTNKDFEKFLDTSDEWIETRTGIKSRHIVPRDKHVAASELGAKAADIAMKRAGIDPDQIDGIICATFTPDSFFPSTACRIQATLGCSCSFAFDISAACAGFIYALSNANALIVAGNARNILVVGSEVISKTLDWTDRSTCILFGDGAGAVLMQGSEENGRGVLSTYMASDGTLGDILMLPSWGEKRTMKMKGNEVFKHAVRMMSNASLRALEMAGINMDQIDLFIPHQANIRIIQSVADHLSIPDEKVVLNLQKYGNTSSASIPLALDEVWNMGLIKEGTKVLLTALGGGVTVGSSIVRF
ncbi:MAG TPA: beta-ketoacyl-ACP synthase III [Chitinispirillaceae bacterium]|nr:beta-ketoacyl-ACP synthase III [Chitinispirillaceae bacterium]